MNNTEIKIDEPCRIDHGNSAYDGREGIVRRATLDHKGRPAAVQVAFGKDLVWFGASVVHPTQEQSA